MNRFEGKISVVTGARSGIGKGVAGRLEREGARVAALFHIQASPAGVSERDT